MLLPVPAGWCRKAITFTIGFVKRPIGRPPRSEGDSVAVETVCAIRRLTLNSPDGRNPTRKALAQALGLRSVATVIERLGVLQRRGLVAYTIGEMRSLVLTAEGERIAVEAEQARQAVAQSERWE